MDQRHFIMHFWDNEPWESGEMLTHGSTGLRFLCSRRQPGPPTPRNWDVLVMDDRANKAEIARQAALDHMAPDAYTDYLAKSAIELASKAIKQRRRTK